MPTILQKSFQEIWISKNMPEDFKTGLIVKLVKKETYLIVAIGGV